MEFRKGKYRHFKGNFYHAIGIARHSETMEEMVVYVREEKPDDLWVRPKAMFLEKVIHEGKEVDRFMWIDELKEN